MEEAPVSSVVAVFGPTLSGPTARVLLFVLTGWGISALCENRPTDLSYRPYSREIRILTDRIPAQTRACICIFPLVGGLRRVTRCDGAPSIISRARLSGPSVSGTLRGLVWKGLGDSWLVERNGGCNGERTNSEVRRSQSAVIRVRPRTVPQT